jgi:opacity protein-like surface antigen
MHREDEDRDDIAADVNRLMLAILTAAILAIVAVCFTVSSVKADTVKTKTPGIKAPAKSQPAPPAPAPTRLAEAPALAPEKSWTGCYAGANLGYATQATTVAGISFDAKDATYGVGAGCDYEVKGMNVVLGVMADIDWTKAESALATFSHSWFAGMRGGVKISNALLVYLLVGYTSLDGSTAIPALSVDNKGLTIGGGLEFKIADQWHLDAQYRNVDLGSDMGGLVEHSQQSVRVGLKYRF